MWTFVPRSRMSGTLITTADPCYRVCVRRLKFRNCHKFMAISIAIVSLILALNSWNLSEPWKWSDTVVPSGGICKIESCCGSAGVCYLRLCRDSEIPGQYFCDEYPRQCQDETLAVHESPTIESLSLFVDRISRVQIQVVLAAVATLAGFGIILGVEYTRKYVMFLCFTLGYITGLLFTTYKTIVIGDIRKVLRYSSCAKDENGLGIFPSFLHTCFMIEMYSSTATIIFMILFLIVYTTDLSFNKQYESRASFVSAKMKKNDEKATVEIPPMLGLEPDKVDESGRYFIITKINISLAISSLVMLLVHCNKYLCKPCLRTTLCQRPAKWVWEGAALLQLLSALPSLYMSKTKPKCIQKSLFMILILGSFGGFFSSFFVWNEFTHVENIFLFFVTAQVLWLFSLLVGGCGAIFKVICPNAVIELWQKFKSRLMACERREFAKYYKKGTAVVVQGESDSKKYLFVNRRFQKAFVPLDEELETLIFDESDTENDDHSIRTTVSVVEETKDDALDGQKNTPGLD